ncbi:MAG TPA: hypothetical protein IAB00_03520 [Candidatus Avidehalobacter gallistercoris]|uniref:Uncharacterized protein n=1 Tax=Candidatus Avidehalobacter gallistercoris TaxID=2840694 RepID=A0A9D1KYH3_9FIRM|nr:hypothetical protein [Candidatus Avidehalobacter gallistercoris]
MIMFTITKPKRKLRKLFSAAALVLLVAVVVPGIYFTLSGMGAMSLFASGEAISEQHDEQTGNTKQTAVEQAGQTEQNVQGEQAKPSEQTAAEQTELAEQSEPVEQKAPEKAGFLQNLRAVFFGEQLEVVPY